MASFSNSPQYQKTACSPDMLLKASLRILLVYLIFAKRGVNQHSKPCVCMAWAAIPPHHRRAVVRCLKKFGRLTTQARYCNAMLYPGPGDTPPERQHRSARLAGHLVLTSWCSGCCYSLSSSNETPCVVDSSPEPMEHEAAACSHIAELKSPATALLQADIGAQPTHGTSRCSGHHTSSLLLP